MLFGGDNNAHEYLGDTWIWRGAWLQMSPVTSPSPRNGAAMAYDGGGSSDIVLFGGESSSGTYFNDTWTWDGTTWTQQSPPVPPSARVANMTYDAATQTVVLFLEATTAPLLSATRGRGTE